MSKFKEYKIKISDKNKELIKDYLKKVKSFIDDNSLDEDLYFDIEERVFEKLSSNGELNELKIKQLINEIGEPEDIFELEDSEEKTGFKNVIQNMIEKSQESLQKTFKTGYNFSNIIQFMKTLLQNLFMISKKLAIKLYGLIKSIFVINSKLFKIVFKFLTSFIGFIILLVSILMLFFVPIMYSGIELGNVNFTNAIPYELFVAYSSLVLAIAILGVYFILKKNLLLHFIIFSVSSILVFSFGFLASTKIYNNYSYIGETEKTYILETDEENLLFGYGELDLYGNIYLHNVFCDEYSFIIKISDDDSFKIKVKTAIYTKNEEKFKALENSFSEFELKEENKHISLSLNERETFKEKTSFTPIKRSIEIYIPENKTAQFSGRLKYYNQQLNDCKSYKFEIKDNKLVCSE